MSNFYDNLNISGNLSINNSSTGNTLYINQLGSGNAVLIEDTTSPDATPFIIDSSGNINVGRIEYLETSSGNKAKLQVNNSTSTIPFSGLPFTTNFIVQGFNQNSVGLFTTDINHSQIYFGTPSDVFGSNIRWDYSNRLLNISTQNTGGTLTLSSGENNEVVRVQSNGYVGIGTNNPIEKLDVSGNTKISGSFTASLTENHVWVGDSNNRSVETPISSLINSSGSNTDDLGGAPIRTIYSRNNQIVYTSGSDTNVDFLENADSNFGSRTITQNFIDNSANYKSKIIHFRVVGKTVFTGNNSDNVSVYLSIGDQKLTETDLGLQSAAFISNKPFEITGELIFSGSQVNSCYSLGWCDQTGDFKRQSKSDPTTPQDISGFTEGDLKIIVSGSTDITMTSYYGYIQVYN